MEERSAIERVSMSISMLFVTSARGKAQSRAAPYTQLTMCVNASIEFKQRRKKSQFTYI